jgi:glutathione S-transferase
MRVSPFRRAAKITYPQHYASAGEMEAAPADRAKALYLLNCAQRAHGNYMENHAIMLVLLFAGGLAYPVASAALAGVWMVGRVMYAVGYTDPNKERGAGRQRGALQYVGILGLLGTACMTTYKMLGF